LETNLLSLIRKNPRISRKQIAEALSFSENTAKEYIEKLKNKKVIRRIGRTSSG
jgi:DNA-binding Lrp family transcriptional regulator